MGLITTIETNAENFYKGFPHLPQTSRAWLAANIWWLTLVGAILIGIAILPVLSVIVPFSLLAIGFGGPVGAAVGGIALLITFIFLGISIVELILFSMAVGRLQERKKRGWDLLFLALVISSLYVLPSLFTFDLGAVIASALGILLGGYLLFEIRNSFIAKKVKK